MIHVTVLMSFGYAFDIAVVTSYIIILAYDTTGGQG